jgi:hypothetical protein
MANARDLRADAVAAASRLQPLKDLQQCTIAASDGDIGTVSDLYFEDQSWTARYLVIDTGGWLVGRKVLLPPHAIQSMDVPGQRLIVKLTKQQVEDSPAADTDQPVSRRYETRLYDYYGFPYYWTGPYRWGLTPLGYATPSPIDTRQGQTAVAEELAARRAEADPHLRSAADVRGHTIQATDGSLGHVEDFLVEADTLAIRYLVVDPISWWPGKHVLVSTDWITGVSWDDRSVEISLIKDAVRNAPEYDPSTPLERAYETRYHRSLGRPGYWERTDQEWRLRDPHDLR